MNGLNKKTAIVGLVLIISLFLMFKPNQSKDSLNLKELPLLLEKTSLNNTSETIGDFFKQYPNQYILINVFASWCPPCKDEMPLIKNLQNQPNIVTIGLNLGESIDTIQAFVAEHNQPFDLVAIDKNQSFYRSLKVKGIPVNILINPKGVVVYNGFTLNEAIMTKLIELSNQ